MSWFTKRRFNWIDGIGLGMIGVMSAHGSSIVRIIVVFLGMTLISLLLEKKYGT